MSAPVMNDREALLSGAVMMMLYSQPMHSPLMGGVTIRVVDDEAGVHRTVIVAQNGEVFRVDVVELDADDPLAVAARIP